ncbi:MAG TPA: hypothetical protein VGZ05_04610, partial [Steroidobacteraceae bacterium]|nr:hypothetical protein [Steroidobacteraceae bacterium]
MSNYRSGVAAAIFPLNVLYANADSVQLFPERKMRYGGRHARTRHRGRTLVIRSTAGLGSERHRGH